MAATLSFDEYVSARSGVLLRFAYVLCGDRHLAEDLVQEVLIKAHRRWSAIEGQNPDAYLKQALVHSHVSWRRRRSASEVTTGAFRDVAALETFDDALASREEVWALLAMLPPRQRAVLVLRYFEDLDDRRIAELVGSSAGAVRVHAHRGLTALRETLAQRAEEAPDGHGMGETVRTGVARAVRHRRLATATGLAAIVAMVALLIVPFLQPSTDVPPTQPTPSVAPSPAISPTITSSPPTSPPTTNSTLALTPVTLTPPVFPYEFTAVPGGLGPLFVGMDYGVLVEYYGDNAGDGVFGPPQLEVSLRPQQQYADGAGNRELTHTSVNGKPATEVVFTSPTVIDLEWEQDPGAWLLVRTNGAVSTDDLHRFAESVRPGASSSARVGGSAQLAGLMLPASYEVDTWNVDTVCAHVVPRETRQGLFQLGRAEGAKLCFTVNMRGVSFGTPMRQLTVDGLPAAIYRFSSAEPGPFAGHRMLEVHRADGRVVAVSGGGLSNEDAISLYHGITYR